MMDAAWMAAPVACVSALFLAPLARHYCMRFGVVDRPGPLKIHARPVPRLGGAAVAGAIVFSIGLERGFSLRGSGAFFAGLFLVCLIGLVDDLRGLPAVIRLGTQISGGLILWWGGWRFPYPKDAAVSGLLTCLFVAMFVNALNFLDGSDGLAAGTTAILGAGFAALFAGSDATLARVVAWSVFGSCAGFLVANFPPARIFLGDSGSTALGFCIAFLSLDLYRARELSEGMWIFPILAAALPLVDFAMAIARRLRAGVSPAHGDRRHNYDLLLQRGWPPRHVMLACWTGTAVTTFLGWLLVRGRVQHAAYLALFPLAMVSVVTIRLGALRSSDGEVRSRAAAQPAAALDDPPDVT